jgi:hypothetical protein
MRGKERVNPGSDIASIQDLAVLNKGDSQGHADKAQEKHKLVLLD